MAVARVRLLAHPPAANTDEALGEGPIVAGDFTAKIKDIHCDPLLDTSQQAVPG